MKLATVGLLILALACGSGPEADGGPEERLRERIDVVSAHVADWAAADSIEAAHASAEAAANHVTGPDGPGFGDRDGDGETRGPTDAGILPGLDGSNSGFAVEAARTSPSTCISDVVLGGDWSDPESRWAQLEDVLARWAPTENTMPELASHPQRVLGWATLTLRTDSLELAHEYAGHARLHVDVSREALEC